MGACAATGVTSCVAGDVQDSCDAGTASANDATCDGADDDCDGETDEDYVALATTCGVGACSATGVTSCVAGGVEDSCVAGTGAANDATCDGVDDDCDGSPDEDYLVLDTSCGVGACAATGQIECQSGVEVDSCEPLAEEDERCNGVDDDCDGPVDEDFADLGAVCDGPDTDSCANGVKTCATDGAGTVCEEAITDIAEDCATLDDENCDGVVNEGCRAVEVRFTFHSFVVPHPPPGAPAGQNYDVSAGGGEAVLGSAPAAAGAGYSASFGFYPILAGE